MVSKLLANNESIGLSVTNESRWMPVWVEMLSINEGMESKAMLSLIMGILSMVRRTSAMVSLSFSRMGMLSFFFIFVVFVFPFWDSRLKYCSNPIPLDTT